MRRRYLIGGRVQGVGFRFFARRAGNGRGISGWVRNLFDGRVEVEAQADADLLAGFEAELRRGPIAASVTEFKAIEISDEPDQPSRFEIR